MLAADRDGGGEVAGLELTEPSQAEAEAMGLRDWPSTVITQGGRAAFDACDAGSACGRCVRVRAMRVMPDSQLRRVCDVC